MQRSQILIYLLFLTSCISPYDFGEGSGQFQPMFVIQGTITDQPGPYFITVSKAIPIQSQEEGSGAVTGASVVIKDDQGNSELLIEETPGNFRTMYTQGVIGHTYTITVTTIEGYIYQSTPQKMLPVGDFHINYKFKLNEDPLTNLQISSNNGFDISVDSEVLPEQENHVRWRWTGTYHIYTRAYLRVKPSNGRKGGWEADAPACSLPLICQCCDCWLEEYNSVPLIYNSKSINSGIIKDKKLAFVEVNRRTFYDKYHLEVEQMSLSKDAFEFWQRIEIQRSNSSNLFQVPPPRAGGNLTALTPNALPVVGYFAASAVKKHSIDLDKWMVPYNLLDIDTIAQDCRDSWKVSSKLRNATLTKPSFW